MHGGQFYRVSATEVILQGGIHSTGTGGERTSVLITVDESNNEYTAKELTNEGFSYRGRYDHCLLPMVEENSFIILGGYGLGNIRSDIARGVYDSANSKITWTELTLDHSFLPRIGMGCGRVYENENVFAIFAGADIGHNGYHSDIIRLTLEDDVLKTVHFNFPASVEIRDTSYPSFSILQDGVALAIGGGLQPGANLLERHNEKHLFNIPSGIVTTSTQVATVDDIVRRVRSSHEILHTRFDPEIVKITLPENFRDYPNVTFVFYERKEGRTRGSEHHKTLRTATLVDGIDEIFVANNQGSVFRLVWNNASREMQIEFRSGNNGAVLDDSGVVFRYVELH